MLIQSIGLNPDALFVNVLAGGKPGAWYVDNTGRWHQLAGALSVRCAGWTSRIAVLTGRNKVELRDGPTYASAIMALTIPDLPFTWWDYDFRSGSVCIADNSHVRAYRSRLGQTWSNWFPTASICGAEYGGDGSLWVSLTLHYSPGSRMLLFTPQGDDRGCLVEGILPMFSPFGGASDQVLKLLGRPKPG
jgi:hypothetical protein